MTYSYAGINRIRFKGFLCKTDLRPKATPRERAILNDSHGKNRPCTKNVPFWPAPFSHRPEQ